MVPEFLYERPEKTDNTRLNDYEAVKYINNPKVKQIQIRESYGFDYGDFSIDFIFGEPGGNGWDDMVEFKNPITPDKVRLVQKDCWLKSNERSWLKWIMSDYLGLPIDEASVDNEIKNCVGLYEFIQI